MQSVEDTEARIPRLSSSERRRREIYAGPEPWGPTKLGGDKPARPWCISLQYNIITEEMPTTSTVQRLYYCSCTLMKQAMLIQIIMYVNRAYVYFCTCSFGWNNNKAFFTHRFPFFFPFVSSMPSLSVRSRPRLSAFALAAWWRWWVCRVLSSSWDTSFIPTSALLYGWRIPSSHQYFTTAAVWTLWRPLSL